MLCALAAATTTTAAVAAAAVARKYIIWEREREKEQTHSSKIVVIVHYVPSIAPSIYVIFIYKLSFFLLSLSNLNSIIHAPLPPPPSTKTTKTTTTTTTIRKHKQISVSTSTENFISDVNKHTQHDNYIIEFFFCYLLSFESIYGINLLYWVFKYVMQLLQNMFATSFSLVLVLSVVEPHVLCALHRLNMIDDQY